MFKEEVNSKTNTITVCMIALELYLKNELKLLQELLLLKKVYPYVLTLDTYLEKI